MLNNWSVPIRRVSILGSTGSIGTQGLEVIDQHRDKFKVVGLSAGSNVSLLKDQINKFKPEVVSVKDEESKNTLLEANFEERENKIRENTPSEFFQSLPEELQVAAKYVADGGQDLKGLFAALAQVEQVRELNPELDSDQEQIVRSYLQATNFGDTDEIEEELTNWKDLGQLEKKAKQFKPKLDAMQEEMVQSRLAQQEMIRKQQEQAANAYVQNVFETLRHGELNGVKLDKKVQNFLYNGLTQPQYPSMSGTPTNLLGHLLEKYQEDCQKNADFFVNKSEDFDQKLQVLNNSYSSLEKAFYM